MTFAEYTTFKHRIKWVQQMAKSYQLIQNSQVIAWKMKSINFVERGERRVRGDRG